MFYQMYLLASWYRYLFISINLAHSLPIYNVFLPWSGSAMKPMHIHNTESDSWRTNYCKPFCAVPLTQLSSTLVPFSYFICIDTQLQYLCILKWPYCTSLQQHWPIPGTRTHLVKGVHSGTALPCRTARLPISTLVQMIANTGTLFSYICLPVRITGPVCATIPPPLCAPACCRSCLAWRLPLSMSCIWTGISDVQEVLCA